MGAAPLSISNVVHVMRSFVYDQPAARVIFGVGSLDRIAEEVKRLGARRAIVLSTPEQGSDAEEAARRLGDMSAAIFPDAVMHVPIEIARAARDVAKQLDADCYVAIGGGSTIGLGKAIALETGMPIVAVPTTFAGSEMTPIYGLTEGGIKKTGRDRKVLPDRKSTRLNSSHLGISYAVFCLKKKKIKNEQIKQHAMQP